MIDEELVEFEEYMVDPEHPNGITVTQDSPLVKQYPEVQDSKWKYC